MVLMWIFIILLLLIPSASPAYDRIISLSPQITESVYLLEAGPRLIADTEFCRTPVGSARKEKIGTPLRPDIEKIVTLKPDVVLGSREGNPPLVMERLRNAGINTHYFTRPKNFSGLVDNFLKLASILGKEGLGTAIVDDVLMALGEKKSEVPRRVLWQVGADPLIVASSSSFANDIILFAGGINIVDTDLPYPRMNMEEVVLKQPQVIVLTSHGYDIEAEKKRWTRYIRDVRFITLDPYMVGSPTPVSFLQAVKGLRETFHAKVTR